MTVRWGNEHAKIQARLKEARYACQLALDAFEKGHAINWEIVRMAAEGKDL